MNNNLDYFLYGVFMVNKAIVNLDANIVVPYPKKPNLIDSNLPNKTLNIELVKAALDYINEHGKDEYNDAMQGMMALSLAYTEVFNASNESITTALLILEDPTNNSLSALSAITNITSGVNKLKNTLSGGLGAINDMVNGFDPTDIRSWAAMAAKLAQFLMCPESSFLADMVAAFKQIKNGVDNIISGRFLKEIKANLTSYINNLIPSKDDIMNFVKNIGAFIGINGSDIDMLIDVIDSTLKEHGLDFNYLYKLGDVIGGVIDFIDPNSQYNKDRLKGKDKNKDNLDPLQKYPESAFNIGEIEAIRCSFLAKIIQQLNNSYRANNRYDDLTLLAEMNPNTSNKELNKLINNYLDYGGRSIDSATSVKNSLGLGLHGKTALNTSLAALVINSNMYKELMYNLDNVNEDEVAFNITCLAAVNNLTYLLGMNHTELSKQKAFREGLMNIMRASDVMNLDNFIK